MAKYERNTSKPKTDLWCEKAKSFNDRMTMKAYDIRSKARDQQKSLEDQYGVKMTQDDENFYLDNCHGEYMAICTNTAPGDWKKKKRREETRKNSAEKKLNEAEKQKQELISRSLDFEDETHEPVADPVVSDQTYEDSLPPMSMPSLDTPTS